MQLCFAAKYCCPCPLWVISGHFAMRGDVRLVAGSTGSALRAVPTFTSRRMFGAISFTPQAR